MILRIIGAVMLLWGLAMPVFLYHTATSDEESTNMALAIGGIICIIWVVVGYKLLRRKGKVKSNVYIMNRHYNYPARKARRR